MLNPKKEEENLFSAHLTDQDYTRVKKMCKKDSFVIIESKIGKIEKKIIDKYNAVYWTVFLIGKFAWISCSKVLYAGYTF